ncbi:transcription elongation factor GreA [Candidatus Saccharibacteria bacterium]|nr:transcription elongation factor GreA [Candidatus Saccharibacteria bacterium]
MMKKSVNLTKEGKKELEEELKTLKARRPEIAEKIATARAFGDLSENEEYSSARSEQKTVENRILEIEDILKNATVIRSASHSKVVLGATVKVKIDGKEKTYSIVGPVEADPLNGKISDASPIGKALLGLKEGEEATWNGKTCKIIKID